MDAVAVPALDLAGAAALATGAAAVAAADEAINMANEKHDVNITTYPSTPSEPLARTVTTHGETNDTLSYEEGRNHDWGPTNDKGPGTSE